MNNDFCMFCYNSSIEKIYELLLNFNFCISSITNIKLFESINSKNIQIDQEKKKITRFFQQEESREGGV